MENLKEREGSVLEPPAKLFSDGRTLEPAEQILSHKTLTWIVERYEIPDEGPALIYFKGMKHPSRGFPYPDALWRTDVVKRMMTAVVDTLGIKQMALPALAIIVMPKKWKIKILNRAAEKFCRLTDYIYESAYIQKKHYCYSTKALWDFTKVFAREIGIEPEIADKLGRIIATVIQYDDAYRYRFQDIASEARSFVLFKDPRREIKRLIDIFMERDTMAKFVMEKYGRPHKFVAMAKIVSMAMLFPWIRNAFKTAMKEVGVYDMIQDEVDEYHTLARAGYKYGGVSDAERWKKWEKVHNDNPPLMIEVSY